MALIEKGEARGQPVDQQKRPQSLGDLWNHPQVRRWALRAGLAVVVGILFAWVIDIRVGLIVAIIAIIADTVLKARSSHGGAEAWRKASVAERKTEKQLRGLAAKGWRVMQARAVPQDRDGASDGKMRAQTMKAITGMTEPTGWHYHTCEGQFVYALKGWVDLEFEDGTQLRVKAGESLFIPGGMRHNETATSNDLQLLEISVPADMGTVACDAPEGWAAKA